MNAIKIRKKKEKKILWDRAIKYIYLVILSCCLIVVNNLHPYEESQLDNWQNLKPEMIYIFHDYAGNQYILNESAHGSASSREYLFNEDIPEEIKSDDKTPQVDLSKEAEVLGDDSNNQGITTIDLGDISYENMEDSSSNVTQKDAEPWNIEDENKQNDSELKKDNQIPVEDIMNELWVGWKDNEKSFVINSSDIQLSTEDGHYTITEISDNETTMIIERKENPDSADNSSNNANPEWNDDNLTEEKNHSWLSFQFLNSGLVLPTLIPREQINFLGYSEYNPDSNSNWNSSRTTQKWENEEKLEPGIHIIDDYVDCMTPWGYKIEHGESVLAYQQLKNTPNICNIERRFCWNGKLSGTYTQQWCSVNEDYSYEISWQANIVHHEEKPKWETKQNSDWSVTVVKKEIWTDFLFDRPSRTYTYDAYTNDNPIVSETPEVDQTERVHRDCTTPRWEKVEHGQFIYAYRHANGFSDSRCEMQIRLCSMWKLKWSYTNPTCKTRDTSFIDWINDSPTWDTYSKEKLEWVKKQIKSEQSYDKEYGILTDSDALDRILTIMEK